MVLALCVAGCSNEPGPAGGIVTRADWQAREPNAGLSTYEQYGLTRPDYTTIVLHVTSMGHASGTAEAHRIQDFHMDQRGFADIGYNFLVDSRGTIFEGRSLDVVPSHAGRSVEADAQHDITRDPDYQSIGIAFSADTDETLSPAQVDAAKWLIRYLQARNPITRIITHTEVRQWLISRGLTPNEEFDPARCPGAGSIEQMIEIRTAVDPSFVPEDYRRLFR